MLLLAADSPTSTLYLLLISHLPTGQSLLSDLVEYPLFQDLALRDRTGTATSAVSKFQMLTRVAP